jgi:PAS domain S-box-containing protein
MQQPLEMIILRQLASYLTIPMWMMDSAGDLIFYNEPAEALLGVHFDDVGPIRAEQLVGMWQVTDTDGRQLPEAEVPVVAALTRQMARHRAIRFRAKDGEWRDVEVSAIPIEGQGKRFLGVLAMFWEVER